MRALVVPLLVLTPLILVVVACSSDSDPAAADGGTEASSSTPTTGAVLVTPSLQPCGAQNACPANTKCGDFRPIDPKAPSPLCAADYCAIVKCDPGLRCISTDANPPLIKCERF